MTFPRATGNVSLALAQTLAQTLLLARRGSHAGARAGHRGGAVRDLPHAAPAGAHARDRGRLPAVPAVGRLPAPGRVAGVAAVRALPPAQHCLCLQSLLQTSKASHLLLICSTSLRTLPCTWPPP